MSELMLDDIKDSLEKLSPAMRQYYDMKQKYMDCILMYRMGDFYEMFFDDAILVSRELDLILTAKACGLEEKAPMCGVPFHAVQNYIAKLVSNGFKVAICEQMQPENAKAKMMDRDVVRIITPGTVIEEEMLEGNKNNYLMSVYKHGEKIGISYVDVSTGDFEVLKLEDNPVNEISDLVSRILPSEIIGNEEAKPFYNSLPVVSLGLNKLHEYYEWSFSKMRAVDNLKKQFGENFEAVYGIKNCEEIICSAGGLFEYILETQKKALSNINKIKLIKNKNYMTIDLNTRRNLEIVETTRDRKKYGSILWILDKTKTTMGARKLRKMVDEPLQSSEQINDRLDAVEELVKKIIMRDRLTEELAGIYDIERIVGKISYGNVTPKDIVTLGISLRKIPQLKDLLSNVKSSLLEKYRDDLIDVSDIQKLIDDAFDEEKSSVNYREGGFIKKGFNPSLDEYRDAKNLGNTWIEKLQEKESEETGIKNLKIGFNRVFGYYIEVSRGQLDKVPLRYERKQTTVNSERFITEDLKSIENKILGAQDQAILLELDIFEKIKNNLTRYVQSFQLISEAIANIDALLSLAVISVKNNYVRPVINKNIHEIKIIDGRHPVVEQFLSSGEFVSNDTFIDDNENKIMILTGPNMAGKSTYMRQVAIITLLAHIGSFVPAREAHIPIIDRIFTRVGASDDLAFGQSTFMVEMSEVAHILANATNKSLIILDEIGRGTSTFDGLSIAWSVVEYLSKNFKAKTLFATHYHELTELEGILDGVKNYKIAVKELDGKVIFLRKILRGGANKSFGIEVAKLAGVPVEVLDRAKEISENLEVVNQKLDLNIFKEKEQKAKDNTKLALNILSIIKDLNINNISPLHAFDILNELILKAKED